MLRHAVAMMNKVVGWTFDPSFKSADITLSNGNRTATHVTTATNYDCALGTVAISGKKVFSITMNVSDGSNGDQGIGVANHSVTLANYYLGNTPNTNSGAMFGSGDWYINNASAGSIYSMFTTNNDVIDVAVDTAAALIWFRVNNGNWNNGANDPAAGTGGISISTITGAIYPGITGSYVAPNASQFTINAASPYSLPSGFSML